MGPSARAGGEAQTAQFPPTPAASFSVTSPALCVCGSFASLLAQLTRLGPLLSTELPRAACTPPVPAPRRGAAQPHGQPAEQDGARTRCRGAEQGTGSASGGAQPEPARTRCAGICCRAKGTSCLPRGTRTGPHLPAGGTEGSGACGLRALHGPVLGITHRQLRVACPRCCADGPGGAQGIQALPSLLISGQGC